MKRFLVAASFAVLTCSAFALPSIGEVQAEIGKGHYTRAEEMTREVIAARPDSARARYVHAEILAHNQRFALAAEEAAQARRLDPGLSFTAPEKFKAFTQLLARKQASANPPAAAQPPARFAVTAQPQAGGGVPLWAWGGAAGLLALLAWRALGARQPARTPWPPVTPAAEPAPSTGMPGAAGAGGFGGYASSPPSAPAGGGMWGTGMAAAGGVAAGMLAEKLFEGRRESSPGSAFLSPSRASDPATFDDRSGRDAAADELQRRAIDMGSGDDWGTDANDRGAAGADDGW